MSDKSKQLVEHLFRTEYGKLVSILTRIFGTSNIQLAEDIVQETLISALDHWAKGGIPDNPTGWLVQVAKRKVINELKRHGRVLRASSSLVMANYFNDENNAVFLQNEIEDNQLRMIFTCCHPSLNVASQIALILKTLCGFGIKQVANALLTTESTINKRLYRAKDSIRKSDVPFAIPQGDELDKRLEAVSLTLYLLFNEGYNATVGEHAIQKDLCLEAVRLTKLLVDHFEKNHKLCALLSLMCFHVARFDARIDHRGAIVLFKDQDRTLWNRELINIGMLYLKRAMTEDMINAYHIEACIGAEHCMAESFENTDWTSIYKQYKLLEKLKPSPIVQLNLAIIQSELDGLETSLKLLDDLAKSKTLQYYHLLPATQGIFNMKLHNYQVAIRYLTKALALKPSLTECKFLEDKILMCKKMPPNK